MMTHIVSNRSSSNDEMQTTSGTDIVRLMSGALPCSEDEIACLQRSLACLAEACSASSAGQSTQTIMACLMMFGQSANIQLASAHPRMSLLASFPDKPGRCHRLATLVTTLGFE